MALRMLAKDETSGRDHCPSVYVEDSGFGVVQGELLDDAGAAQLENVLPGEGAVRIRMDVLEAAVRRYHEGPR